MPGYEGATARAYVDGKRAGEDRLIERTVGANLRNMPAEILAVVGKIAITNPETLDKVKAGIAVLQAEIDLRPTTIRRRLHEQRATLAENIGYIVSAWGEERERRIERASATGIMRAESRDYTAEHAVATAALAEFDAAHPEVLVAIEAERAENVARWSQQ